MFGTFFYDKVQVEPAIIFSLLVVELLHFCGIGDRNPVIEEYDSFSREQPLLVILQFCVNFEFHDFTQLTDRQVITHMKSEEEPSDQSLIIDHFHVNWFYHNCEQAWMLKPKIFIFNFPLSYTHKNQKLLCETYWMKRVSCSGRYLHLLLASCSGSSLVQLSQYSR